jgi:hypothetical protein
MRKYSSYMFYGNALKRQLNVAEICKSLSQKAVRRKRAISREICELSTNSFMAQDLAKIGYGQLPF